MRVDNKIKDEKKIITNLQNEIDKIRKELSIINKEKKVFEDKADTLYLKLKIKEDELATFCKHTSTNTTTSYVEGGYLNVSETTYHTYCTSCKKLLKEKTEYGTYA